MRELAQVFWNNLRQIDIGPCEGGIDVSMSYAFILCVGFVLFAAAKINNLRKKKVTK